MLAMHRFFGGGGVRVVTVIRLGVTVSGAHGAGATGHPTRFQGGSQKGRPKKQDSEEAHRCRQFLSRSDRRVERRMHWVPEKNTAIRGESQHVKKYRCEFIESWRSMAD